MAVRPEKPPPKPDERRPFTIDYDWSAGAILGYIYSLSGVDMCALGGPAKAFESEIRETLLSYDARGEYAEAAQFYLILAQKPR